MKVFPAKELILISIPLFLLFILHSSCHSLDRITPSQTLKDGDVLLSEGATFALVFFTPSNNSRNRYVGIWYNRVSEQTVVWVANRDNPLNDTSGVFSINTHGNAVVVLNGTNPHLNPIWSSNVSLSSPINTFAKLLGTGHLVLIDNGGRQKVLWQSFDYPGDTLLPFMKIGLDRKTGLDRFLRSWKSPDDPGFGNVSHRIDPTGYPQLFMYKNGDPLWRDGSWTGQKWSGIPEMTSNFMFNVSFVDNASEVTIMYGVKVLKDPSVFFRMVLDDAGRVTRTIWQAQKHRWLEVWYGPKEDSDNFKRFEPKNPRRWYLRDRSGGCVRKKNVSTCRSGEGFVKVARVKVPGTSKASVDKRARMSLKGCEENCLKNCSCVAYTSANEITEWVSDVARGYGRYQDVRQCGTRFVRVCGCC